MTMRKNVAFFQPDVTVEGAVKFGAKFVDANVGEKDFPMKILKIGFLKPWLQTVK